MSAVKAAWRTVIRLQSLLEALDSQKGYEHGKIQGELNSIILEWSLDEKKLQTMSGVPPIIIRHLLHDDPIYDDPKFRNPQNRTSPHMNELSQIADTRKLANGLLAHFMSSGSSNLSQAVQNRNETSVVRLQVLLVSQASLSLLLELREQVRGDNFDPEDLRLQKLQSIEELMLLVEESQEIHTSDNPSEVETAGSWGARFRSALFENFVDTFTPENIASATIPTSIILTCSSLGSLIAGPVGLGAGGVLGHILTRQLKPGQAADRLQEALAETDAEQAKASN